MSCVTGPMAPPPLPSPPRPHTHTPNSAVVAPRTPWPRGAYASCHAVCTLARTYTLSQRCRRHAGLQPAGRPAPPGLARPAPAASDRASSMYLQEVAKRGCRARGCLVWAAQHTQPCCCAPRGPKNDIMKCQGRPTPSSIAFRPQGGGGSASRSGRLPERTARAPQRQAAPAAHHILLRPPLLCASSLPLPSHTTCRTPGWGVGAEGGGAACRRKGWGSCARTAGLAVHWHAQGKWQAKPRSKASSSSRGRQAGRSRSADQPGWRCNVALAHRDVSGRGTGPRLREEGRQGRASPLGAHLSSARHVPVRGSHRLQPWQDGAQAAVAGRQAGRPLRQRRVVGVEEGGGWGVIRQAQAGSAGSWPCGGAWRSARVERQGVEGGRAREQARTHG